MCDCVFNHRAGLSAIAYTWALLLLLVPDVLGWFYADFIYLHVFCHLLWPSDWCMFTWQPVVM